jgi:hypothetical protein
MTLARTLKLYKLPEQTQTPGLRPLKAEDAPQVRLSASVLTASLFVVEAPAIAGASRCNACGRGRQIRQMAAP